MTWATESAEIIAADATLVECRVCHAPVRDEDEPLSVLLIAQDGLLPGVIHGAFSCMDEERCFATMSDTTSSGEWSAQCILPTGHGGDHLPGPGA